MGMERRYKFDSQEETWKTMTRYFIHLFRLIMKIYILHGMQVQSGYAVVGSLGVPCPRAVASA